MCHTVEQTSSLFHMLSPLCTWIILTGNNERMLALLCHKAMPLVLHAQLFRPRTTTPIFYLYSPCGCKL